VLQRGRADHWAQVGWSLRFERGGALRADPARSGGARFWTAAPASEAAPHRRHGGSVARPSAQQGGAWTISCACLQELRSASISFIEAARTTGSLHTIGWPALRFEIDAHRVARPRSREKAPRLPSAAGPCPLPVVAAARRRLRSRRGCVPADAHVHHSREKRAPALPDLHQESQASRWVLAGGDPLSRRVPGACELGVRELDPRPRCPLSGASNPPEDRAGSVLTCSAVASEVRPTPVLRPAAAAWALGRRRPSAATTWRCSGAARRTPNRALSRLGGLLFHH